MVVGNVGDAVDGFDIEARRSAGDNFEVGFNMTDIQDAFVNTAQVYDDPRAVGGQVPSGLG